MKERQSINNLLVSHLMCYSVRQSYPVIFIDAATFVGIAHTADVRYSQRVAGHVLSGAYVLPRDQNGDIVVVRMCVVPRIEVLLPLAEVPQCRIRIHANIEQRLRGGIIDENYLHHDHINIITDAGIHVQRGYLQSAFKRLKAGKKGGEREIRDANRYVLHRWCS